MTNGQSFFLSFPKKKKGYEYEIVYDDFGDDIINYNFTKNSELFRN